jgi:hypothetical protein
MSESDIFFTASVARVSTLADGGLRITFDLPEQSIGVAAQLMECKRVGAAIEMTGKAKLRQLPEPIRIVEHA